MTENEKPERYNVDWGGSIAIREPCEVHITQGEDRKPVAVTLLPLTRRGFPLPKPKVPV